MWWGEESPAQAVLTLVVVPVPPPGHQSQRVVLRRGDGDTGCQHSTIPWGVLVPFPQGHWGKQQLGMDHVLVGKETVTLLFCRDASPVDSPAFSVPPLNSVAVTELL